MRWISRTNRANTEACHEAESSQPKTCSSPCRNGAIIFSPSCWRMRFSSGDLLPGEFCFLRQLHKERLRRAAEDALEERPAFHPHAMFACDRAAGNDKFFRRRGKSVPFCARAGRASCGSSGPLPRLVRCKLLHHFQRCQRTSPPKNFHHFPFRFRDIGDLAHVFISYACKRYCQLRT